MSTGSWSLVPSGSKLEPAQLLCWYKCCHICLQLQHLSYLQDTHPSQLARFFFHSIIVQLVEAKGTVWSADTFFRKTEKVSISSEIHHELLGKKKSDEEHHSGFCTEWGEQSYKNSCFIPWLWDGEGWPRKVWSLWTGHPVYIRCCHEVSTGPCHHSSLGDGRLITREIRFLLKGWEMDLLWKFHVPFFLLG